jgi:hypothetical protein
METVKNYFGIGLIVIDLAITFYNLTLLVRLI